MSPVKCLRVSFAFESELHSLAWTQRNGSILHFLGGARLQAYPSVAGHWDEYQIKVDLSTLTFFLPSLTASNSYKILFSALHLVQLLLSFSPCVFKEATGTLHHFRLHLIYAWISSLVLLVFTTSLSKTLSSFLGSKNSLQIPLAYILSLQQVTTEYSDLVAFPTAMDINISK